MAYHNSSCHIKQIQSWWATFSGSHYVSFLRNTGMTKKVLCFRRLLNIGFLDMDSHRSLSVGGRWTSWAGWRPLSSSVWQWSGRGQPGMWAGSPSSSAGLCRPARSPGKAGRSREPGALSYSNMCFQTEERQVHKHRGGQEGGSVH